MDPCTSYINMHMGGYSNLAPLLLTPVYIEPVLKNDASTS